jgi:ABC-type glycerol-3-phosphate transport system substrate-binding protein
VKTQSRRKFLKGTFGTSILLLAACAPAAPAPSPTAAPAKPADAKPTAAAAAPAATAAPAKPAESKPAAQAPATKQPATVEVWHTEPNELSIKAFDNIAARFNQKYPNVTVTQAPQGWADMEKKILAGIAAGTLPEISQAIQYVTPSIQSKELLLPLDDVVNSIGKDNIFPHVRDTAALYPDNHWYGITHAWGCDVWIYRGDLADKKGLKEPRTWDELTNFVKELHDDAAGIAGIQLAGTPGFFVNEDFQMFTGQDGGTVWKADGQPNWTSKEAVAALNYYKTLLPYQPKGWLTQGWTETNINLAKGSVAMISGYGRSVNWIREHAPDRANPEVFRPMKYKPVGPDNSKPPEQGMITQMDGEHWVVYKQSKAPEWAIEFLKFFYERENYLEYADSVPLHMLPIDIRLFRDQEYLAHPVRTQWKQLIDIQFDYMDKKLGWPLLMTQASDQRIPHIAEVANSGIIADMMYDVVDKGMSAEQAAEKGQRRAEQLIKDLK